MAKDKRFLISIKPGKHKKLKILSAKLGQPMNSIVRKILDCLLLLDKEDYNELGEQYNKLESIAETQGKTESFIVQQAFREFILKHTKKG